jgi:hypothetical protein
MRRRRSFSFSLLLFLLVYATIAVAPVTAQAKPSYVDFLNVVVTSQFNVIPVAEFNTSYRQDKVNVLLRHDLDSMRGYEMATLDLQFGVRSTFYLRLHANSYYGLEDVAAFYQAMEARGFEVGYHYEVMDQCFTQTVNSCALNLFKAELAKLRTYFNVRSCSSHGGVWNYLFHESPDWPKVSRELNIVEAYRLPIPSSMNYTYLSDVSGANVTRLKGALLHLPLGVVVQVNIHPEHWSYGNPVPEGFSLPLTLVAILMLVSVAVTKMKKLR